MRRHALIPLAVALVAATAVPAGAAPARPPRPPRISGTVTVSARSTAAIRVVLDTPLWFGYIAAETTGRVTGRGRVVGAMLVSVEEQRWVGLMRFGFCDEPRCHESMPRDGKYKGEFSSKLWTSGRWPGWKKHPTRPEVEVPSGVYDLVVLTDGEPVTVTLPFLGGGRSTSVTATEPRRAGIESALATMVGPTGEVHAGQDIDAQRPHGRVGEAMLWVLAESLPVVQEGWACSYPGGVAATTGDPYEQGCPGVPNHPEPSVYPCDSYVPGGHLEQWVSTPMIDGYFFLMAGCSRAIQPGDRLANGIGTTFTGTAGGVTAWWVED